MRAAAGREEPLDGWARAGVVLAVAGVPLLVWPFGDEPHTPLRLAGLALVLLAALRTRRTATLPAALLVALGAGLLVATVAAALGDAPLAQLVGRYPRSEGLPLLVGYAGALLAGARLAGLSAAGRELMVRSLEVVVVILAVVAVVETMVGADRVRTTLGNASAAGVFGAMALGLLVHRWLARPTPRALPGIVAAVLLVGLTASRGALLGAALAVVVATALAAGPLRHRAVTAGAALGGLVVVGAALPLTRARLTGASELAGATVTGRRLLWEETWQLVLAHPVLGVGPSGFVDAVGRFHTPRWQQAVGPGLPPDSPHDVVLQVLAAGGVAGLLAALVAGGLVLGSLVRRRAEADGWSGGVLAGAAGAGGVLLTHFTDAGTMVPLLVLVGSAVAVPAGALPRWAERAVGALLAVTAGGLLVLSVTGLVGETAIASGARALSAGTDPTPSFDLARSARPWDGDTPRRTGQALARYAEAQGAGGAADAAVLRLRKAVRALPDSGEAWSDLGLALDLAGRPEEAVGAYDRAVRLEPTNPATLLRRGVALAGAGRAPAAEADFLAAARLRPRDVAPWENLAGLRRSVGDEAGAAQADREAAARR